jgi:exodeoxyribonuclease V alpha subunit
VTQGLFSNPPGQGRVTSLEGVLERITYVSEESGWSVVRLQVPGKQDLVTAVGNLLGVQPGESLRLTGRWAHDRKYGEQFRVESFLTVQPATLVGLEKYLGSGMVRGMGKVMASRLVKRFGIETLDVIEHQPWRLTHVKGIGPKRKERILAAWSEHKAIKEVMVFLQSNGVSPSYAAKICRRYGQRAIAVVKDNPYQLAEEIFGIGFKTADQIASNLGITPDSPDRARAGVLHVLGQLAEEGHVYCPRESLVEQSAAMLEIERSIAEQAIDELAAEEADPRLVVDRDQAVYLVSLHVSETGAADRLRAILDAPAPPFGGELEGDLARAIAGFEQQQGLVLAEQQRQAIRAAVASKVLVITGGPGTGKTTIVNGILRLLEREGRSVLLCAPTGRAAKRLSETSGQEAKTIHRLLEFNPQSRRFERNAENPLEADLVVVDETSMVDIVLLYNLLKAVPDGCQLVLVGDVDQLPSVGPGCVLRDLIQSGVVAVVTLTEIFRQARQSLIVVNAHQVNAGELPLGLPGTEEPELPKDQRDFFFIEREEPEAVLATIKELVRNRIPRRFSVDPLLEIQVLTPMHRGLLGSRNLNAELQQLLNPKGQSIVRGSRLFRVGDKVMQIRNNYDLDVFNGDLGQVTRIDEVERQLSVRVEEREVSYDLADLDELVLGYACSVHKAQGSEYPVVVMPLHTQHYVMLQRNLLYTGLTRGKRLVVVVGSRRALGLAVQNNQVRARHTNLASRLARSLDPEL